MNQGYNCQEHERRVAHTGTYFPVIHLQHIQATIGALKLRLIPQCQKDFANPNTETVPQVYTLRSVYVVMSIMSYSFYIEQSILLLNNGYLSFALTCLSTIYCRLLHTADCWQFGVICQCSKDLQQFNYLLTYIFLLPSYIVGD